MDSVRALNVGANVLNARMNVVENETAILEVIVFGLSTNLVGAQAAARSLADTVSYL
jgi:hypothetical protein